MKVVGIIFISFVVLLEAQSKGRQYILKVGVSARDSLVNAYKRSFLVQTDWKKVDPSPLVSASCFFVIFSI